MSSIATDDYRRALARIQSNGHPSPVENTSLKKNSRSFGVILAEIETNSRDPNKANNNEIANKADDRPNLPPPSQIEALPFFLSEHDSSELPLNRNYQTPERANMSLAQVHPFLPIKLLPPEYPLGEAPPAHPFNGILGDIPIAELGYTPIGSLQKGTPGDLRSILPLQVPDEPTQLPEEPKIIPSQEITSANSNSKQRAPSASPFSQAELQRMINVAGQSQGIDPSLALAIAKIESAFNPNAISSDGHFSKGLFQLLDSTGLEVHEGSGISDPYQPFNPLTNTKLGIQHLRRLHDIFSKDTQLTNSLGTRAAKSAEELEKLAVAAYNTGEGNVAKAQAKAHKAGKDASLYASIEPYLPLSTRDYVKKVHSAKIDFANLETKNFEG